MPHWGIFEYTRQCAEAIRGPNPSPPQLEYAIMPATAGQHVVAGPVQNSGAARAERFRCGLEPEPAQRLGFEKGPPSQTQQGRPLVALRRPEPDDSSTDGIRNRIRRGEGLSRRAARPRRPPPVDAGMRNWARPASAKASLSFARASPQTHQTYPTSLAALRETLARSSSRWWRQGYLGLNAAYCNSPKFTVLYSTAAQYDATKGYPTGAAPMSEARPIFSNFNVTRMG